MLAIPELRKKLLVTVGLLFVFRLGVFVPVPGIDGVALNEWFRNQAAGGGIFGNIGMWISAFTGGAFSRAGIFALGIMPYITASIIMQLLQHVVPALEKLAKEGQTGQQKINEYSRYLTVAICFFQGYFIIGQLGALNDQVALDGGRTLIHGDPTFFGFTLPALISVAAGGIFLMWLGEQITEYGIGNGASLLIMAGIVADMPGALFELFRGFSWNPVEGETGPFKVGVLLLLYIGIVVGIVFITQGQRRIPMQHARQVRGRRVTVGQRTYLPLKVNQANVMPVIFAGALLTMPIVVASLVTQNQNAMSWFTPGQFVYTLPFVVMIFFFAYFYTAMVFNPETWADNLKQHGSFIPGIRPGQRTAEYLERIMNRVTLAGAAFLAAIAIAPPLLARLLDLPAFIVYSFLGGTGLLIVVGVALDLMQKIESHLLMRHYEGFSRKSKMGGR